MGNPMTGARFWPTAVASAVLTAVVAGILLIPFTTITGTGPMPAAVLNLPASCSPSPATPAAPVPPRGSRQAVETLQSSVGAGLHVCP